MLNRKMLCKWRTGFFAYWLWQPTCKVQYYWIEWNSTRKQHGKADLLFSYIYTAHNVIIIICNGWLCTIIRIFISLQTKDQRSFMTRHGKSRCSLLAARVNANQIGHIYTQPAHVVWQRSHQLSKKTSPVLENSPALYLISWQTVTTLAHTGNSVSCLVVQIVGQEQLEFMAGLSEEGHA